jgi:uncharacterized LabA/DUF88 family protein
MPEKTNKKIYAFIDSQNLNLSIKDSGWDLDFGRFRKYLSDKYNASKTFLFIGYLSGNESLYAELQQNGYVLIFKPTLLLPGGKAKGNVDAELVLHAMIQYDNYDQAIIVSGDGDFYCLIEHLAKKQKLFKVLIPNRSKYSSLLRKFRGFFAFVDVLENKLGKKKKPPMI